MMSRNSTIYRLWMYIQDIIGTNKVAASFSSIFVLEHTTSVLGQNLLCSFAYVYGLNSKPRSTTGVDIIIGTCEEQFRNRRGSRNFSKGGGLRRKILKEKCLLVHVSTRVHIKTRQTSNCFFLLPFQEDCLPFFALFYHSFIFEI